MRECGDILTGEYTQLYHDFRHFRRKSKSLLISTHFQLASGSFNLLRLSRNQRNLGVLVAPPQVTSEQSCIATYHMTRPCSMEVVRVWVRFPRITQLTIIVLWWSIFAFHSLRAAGSHLSSCNYKVSKQQQSPIFNCEAEALHRVA